MFWTMQQMIKSDVKFELWTIHFGLEKEKQKKKNNQGAASEV